MEDFDQTEELYVGDYIVQHESIAFEIPPKPITKKDMARSEFMDDMTTLFEVWAVFELTALTLPQIGVAKKGFLFSEYHGNMNSEAKTGVSIALNPKIISKSKEMHLSIETCPSVDGGETAYLVKRHDEIVVQYQTLRETEPTISKLTGVKADSFQYAMDMLDGIFICDSGSPIKVTEDQIQLFKETEYKDEE